MTKKQSTLDGSDYEEPQDEEEENLQFFKDNGITPDTECKICGEKAKDIYEEYDRYSIEDGTFSNKLEGWVCFPCRESAESTPNGTVLIFKPSENIVEKYIITDTEDFYGQKEIYDSSEIENVQVECYDYEESPINLVWHSTDAWRGHYEPEAKDWKVLHSDCILSYSEDAEQLKEFDTDIKQVLWELGYDFALVFGRTSNVFSCGYDIMIRTNDEKDAIKQMAMYAKLVQLQAKYRDNDRFMRTALTGSGENTKEARLLVKAEKMLREGKDFEEVKKEILEEEL